MLRRPLSFASSVLLRCGHQLNVSSYRLASAWIWNELSASEEKEGLNVEKLFTNEEVQRVLREMTGMDLEQKIFKARPTATQERSHYALMTDEMLKRTVKQMESEAERFLQFVPLKEPRSETPEVLSNDPEISGFDQSKFVFTDISYDVTDKNRVVVVRETDGVLRLANPEEHDRMNRVFFEKPNRPVIEPSLFSDPFLKESLARDDHDFVLDWACYFYEPDDPAFVKLSREIFDRTVADKKFSALYSTRHFGPFTFYLALNGNIPPLLNFFGSLGSLSNAAKLIRLQKIIHRDWRTAIGSDDDDRKIVDDYIRQNANLRDQLPDLISLVQGEKTKKELAADEELPAEKPSREQYAKAATLDRDSIRGRSGPLGELSSEYTVMVARSSRESEKDSEPEEEPKKTPRRERNAPARKFTKPKSGTNVKPKS